MKVTYNWLKDFVEIKVAPRALADKLTMAGLEVTSLEEKDGDFVFEIEVTSNRPDCLSVIGVAREVAAVTNAKLNGSTTLTIDAERNRSIKTQNDKTSLKIGIENKKDCPLYTAKIIRDVKVGPPPGWLKKRLELVGCRSVNNIVDITNYILFELGEPLHAFDLDKLSPDEIIVRRAVKGEKIITIDAQQRMLDPDILVIADKERPVAIAGVMGAKDTEVTESTKNVLLEAAVFNPIIVRRARQSLGIESESAYRFERGIDLEMVEDASLRATGLIQELAGGRCVLIKSSGKPKTKSKSISLDTSTVEKILGADIAPVRIKQILNNLEFKTKTKVKNNFKVQVPSHRQDVNLEIDLIEEIARIFGYEFIPTSLPAVVPQVSVSRTQDSIFLIKNILAGMGLNEVITYGLIDKELLRSFGREGGSDAIEILNPLSKEQEILRPALIPSLARCVAYNLNQKQGYINIFEIAKVFSGTEQEPEEKLTLGIALCGMRSLWVDQGHIQDKAGFLHLKGILEALLERLGIKKEECAFISKNSYEFEAYVKEVKIGVLKKLERAILDRLDIKNKEVFIAEIALEKVFPYIQINKRFIPLARYPGVSRDISLVLKEDIPVEEVIKLIGQRGGELLQEVETADYYKGKQIPAGYKGLTISCLYRSDERTLTEAEINPVHTLICDMLSERFDAKIR